MGLHNCPNCRQAVHTDREIARCPNENCCVRTFENPA